MICVSRTINIQRNLTYFIIVSNQSDVSHEPGHTSVSQPLRLQVFPNSSFVHETTSSVKRWFYIQRESASADSRPFILICRRLLQTPMGGVQGRAAARPAYG